MNHSSLLIQRLQSRPANASKRSEAFNALDMIMGGVISILLVGTLGGAALISELRFAENSEVSQSLRDSWGRSLAFISSEAQHAYWIRTTITTPPGYPCGGESPKNPLVLDGPPNPADPTMPIWRVVYGVKANLQSNGKASTDWRGANRLVRCGPAYERIARDDSPLQTRSADLRAAALSGNLSFLGASTETVIADQLPVIKEMDCPSKGMVGPCYQPFQARLFTTGAAQDRDANLSLYMSRVKGGTYPPSSFTGFHAQIRANRNPGFDSSGNPSCKTQTDSLGNQEPQDLTVCQSDKGSGTKMQDSMRRSILFKEYDLPNPGGNLLINSCGPGCDSARSTDFTDVIYLKGTYDDFTTKQFSATDAVRPCSRKSCYLSNGSQSVQIYDGDIVVFFDRILRL